LLPATRKGYTETAPPSRQYSNLDEKRAGTRQQLAETRLKLIQRKKLDRETRP
jgi:hypothetical protein